MFSDIEKLKQRILFELETSNFSNPSDYVKGQRKAWKKTIKEIENIMKENENNDS